MLARQYGRFDGETEDEQFELLRWLFWDNHKLTGYMATYRFTAPSRRRRTSRCKNIFAAGSTISCPSSNSI